MIKNKVNFSLQERITHALMLHSFAISEFFKRTNNDVFADFYYDLLADVMENVNKGLTLSLNSGLSGIGWGIEYLIQNGFVQGESVDICEEIDNRIMETDPRRIADLSLDTGFEGLLHYIVCHVQGAINQKTVLPFDHAYLSDIYAVCKNLVGKDISNSLQSLSQMFIQFIEQERLPNYAFQVMDFAKQIPDFQPDKLSTYPLGLHDGLAGVLLHLLEKEENA